MQRNQQSLEQRLEFVRIDEAARRDLQGVWEAIHPVLPQVLERFYGHLTAVPYLRQLIGPQQSRLIAAQSKHWEHLFSGRFDAAYVASIRQIGLTHHRIGLEPNWYIGGYAFILSELTAVLGAKHRFNAGLLARRTGALIKAVMLDMDYAISVYQDVLIEERQQRGKALADAIDAFSVAVQGSLSVAGEAGRALAESASTLSTVTGEASGLASEVNHAAEMASENMQAGAAATEELSISVREIGQQASRSAEVARNAVSSARQTNRSVVELAERAREIGQVVQLINEIAAQTNLLALNATIEAARAGEAGKGFAVVAQEVKSLAGQTAKATTEISTRIGAIQEATRQSAADIQGIATVIEEVSVIATSIAAAVEEQTAVTSELARTVQQTSQNSQSVVASIETLHGSTNAARNAADKVSTTRETLELQLARLKQDIETFLSTAKAA
jgi:methyl-accepting chemotaxis protein